MSWSTEFADVTNKTIAAAADAFKEKLTGSFVDREREQVDDAVAVAMTAMVDLGGDEDTRFYVQLHGHAAGTMKGPGDSVGVHVSRKD